MQLKSQNLKFIHPDNFEDILSEEQPEINCDGCAGHNIINNCLSDSMDSVEKQRQNLPVFIWRNQFLYLLETSRVVVITGETGSGKSTQLPQYVYEAGWLNPKPGKYSPFGATMAVTQPRRVAALTLATRVAEEKNWKLGTLVGYSIRFEECTTPGVTVISYLTEGMLIQEFLRDPLLNRFRVIMLDEVHERSVQTDILLGLMKKVLRKRPNDLRIIISSATLEADKFIDYFNDIKFPSEEGNQSLKKLNNVSHLSVQGRQHPVHIFYTASPIPCYLKKAKDTAFQIHESKPPGGDILIFVSSQNEVVQLVGELVDEYRKRKENYSTNQSQKTPYPPLRSLPLHGALPHHEQLRIFERPTRACRKVVVATNVAEASVTLPGISYVIDTGFGRLRAYNPITGLETLITVPISQASARQRAGRAGRTRAGEVYRLYTEETYNNLPKYTLPEALRIDLSGALLRLKSFGIDRLAQFDWLDRPPPQHIGQSAEKLVALKALDPLSGRLVMPYGLKLAEMSTVCGLDQPSAAASLLGACDEGCSQEIAAIVSIMQIQRIFIAQTGQKRTGDRIKRQLFGCKQGDHLTELNAFMAYEKQRATKSASELRNWCRDIGLNDRGLSHAIILRDRIRAIFHRLKLPWVKAEPEGNPEPILRALVRGFFHQVARLSPSGSHYLTVRGDHQLRLHPDCVLSCSTSRWPNLILFTNVILSSNSDSTNSSDFTSTLISGVSVLQPEWLLELVPHYYQFGTDREHLEKALLPTKH